MKLFNILKKNYQNLFFIIILSISECYYSLRMIYNYSNSFILSCFAVTICILIAVIVISLPKKLPIYLLFIFAVFIIFTAVYYNKQIADIIGHSISALIDKSFFHIENEILFIFALSLAFIAINYIIISVFNQSIVAALLSAAVICVIYFSYDFINIPFAIFYVIGLLMIVIWRLSPRYAEEEESVKVLIPFKTVLFAAIIIAPLVVIVASQRPDPLKWIDELDWFEKETATINTEQIIRIDGQSKLTNLSDDFAYSDSKMMIVNTPYVDRLRNKTYDIYTKDGWEKALSDDSQNMDKQYDIYELEDILDSNGVSTVLYEMNVELFAHSQIVFAPLHSLIASDFSEEIYKNPYDDIYTDKSLISNTIYYLNALHIDYKSEEFIEFITQSKSNNINNVENYLQIPEELKSTLEPLTTDLVKDADNNYLKAKIIESYLSNKYTYNLEPPEKPVNEDFIEYFLFETKEGFCTHYATSMVMMLRSIGVPCRYVTGYILEIPIYEEYIPMDAPEQVTLFVEGISMDFTVKKKHSHAWVEVWFDDFGWLAFEPTSRFQSELGFAGDNEYNDFEHVDLLITQDEALKHEYNNQLFAALLLVLLIVLLTVFFIRLYIVTHKANKKNIIMIFNRIKRQYYRKNKMKKVNETAREFYYRADCNNDDLFEAVKIYEEVIFSNKTIEIEQLENLRKIYKNIRNSLTK